MEPPSAMTKPSVLFICVHNAGRSQMAVGWLMALAGDRIEVRSAGSKPADVRRRFERQDRFQAIRNPVWCIRSKSG